MTDANDTGITKSSFVAGANTDFVATSGTINASALSGLNGPWYITRQELDITYVRVPTQQFTAASSTSVSLTGCTTSHTAIEGTHILFYATAKVSGRVVNQAFSTSGAQQPQTFIINAASADINGVSYGNITASTMGAMGTIQTENPFIRREIYTSGTYQPLFDKTLTFSNHAQFFSQVPNPVNPAAVLIPGETVNATQYFYDLGHHKDTGAKPGTTRTGVAIKNTYLYPELPATFAVFGDYQIPGAFNVSKESLQQIRGFINDIATRLSAKNHHDWPISNEIAFGSQIIPAADVGIPEYDVNRHA